MSANVSWVVAVTVAILHVAHVKFHVIVCIGSIACRLWLPERRGTPMLMKSDSLAALRLCLTLGSKSVELNKIGCELALDHADDRYELHFLEHIPGVANTTPDGLSRMYAPIPFERPSQCLNMLRVVAPPRDSCFWRC
jgi:hypothetical protein